MTEVILEENTSVLEEIWDKRIPLTPEEESVVDEYGFVFDCGNDKCDEKCKCWNTQQKKFSIRLVKHQTLAYKLINTLVNQGTGINRSHWRTEWRRTHDPSFEQRKPRAPPRPKKKMFTEEEVFKLTNDESYRKDFNKKTIKELEQRRQELNAIYQDLHKDYNDTLNKLKELKLAQGEELDDELLNHQVEGELAQEFQHGGGVDQHEDPEDPEEEEEQEHIFRDQQEEETTRIEPTPEKKKRGVGRPKGKKVTEAVARLEGQEVQQET